MGLSPHPHNQNTYFVGVVFTVETGLVVPGTALTVSTLVVSAVGVIVSVVLPEPHDIIEAIATIRRAEYIYFMVQ